MKIHSPSLIETIIAQARIASEYHRLGYKSDSNFNADVMIRLMDQLGELIDEFDGNSLVSGDRTESPTAQPVA